MTSGRITVAAVALLLAAALLAGAVAQPVQSDPPAVAAAADPAEPVAAMLTARFAGIEGLGQVGVRQHGGVLILDGEVLSDADRELAATIARGADGVREVVNDIEISTSLRARIADSTADSLRRLERFLGMAPLLLVALLLVAASWWASGWLARRVWLGPRLRGNSFVAGLLRSAIRLAGLLLGLVLALRLLDAVALAGALLGSAGIIGIAIGFAFRDTVENYIASIMLSVRQPFRPDDHVVIDGHEGIVVGLNSRATVLMTPAGNHLRLPNALVFKAVMLNYSRNPNRRFEFGMQLAPQTSASLVLEHGLAELRALPGVLAEPAPAVQVAGASRDALEMQFSAWVDQRASNFGWVRSEAIRRVRERLRRHGVAFDGPTLTLARDGEAMAEEPVLAARVPPRDESVLQAAVDATRAEMGDSDLLRDGAAQE